MRSVLVRIVLTARLPLSPRSYGGGSFSFSNLIQAVTRRFSTEEELQAVRSPGPWGHPPRKGVAASQFPPSVTPGSVGLRRLRGSWVSIHSEKFALEFLHRQKG